MPPKKGAIINQLLSEQMARDMNVLFYASMNFEDSSSKIRFYFEKEMNDMFDIALQKLPIIVSIKFGDGTP